MFVSPSVRLSLSLYTYIHIYILILYTYYVRFVRSAIWGPFILRPICIGRCLPQGYSQWGAEFFTSTEIHGFPVDPLQSSRSQVHATGVAVSEGLAEKGWVGRCLHLVIYIHTHTNISHSTCIWLYMYICIQSYIYMHSIYIYAETSIDSIASLWDWRLQGLTMTEELPAACPASVERTRDFSSKNGENHRVV